MNISIYYQVNNLTMDHKMNREELKKLKRLKRKIKHLSWFPSYQTFGELGIKGRRNDDKRYSYLDFSICKNKVVVDYGCNIGQTSVLAAKASAKRVIGFDSQFDSIEVAREIKDLMELNNLEFYQIDFNDNDYQQKVLKILNNDVPDISFFLSVYRTKELKDRDGLFQFIIDNTREIVFFEGHSVKEIDTVDFYMNLFNRFNIKGEFLGYSQENTRPFFIIRL